MDLILWRHADSQEASSGESDLERKLNARGERQAERMAQWLNQRLTHSTRILVSPALRCQQTAKALGRKSRTVATIGPGASAAEVIEAAGWPRAATPVLIVGHQPTLGIVASTLLTGSAQAWTVKKAAVWWLRHRPRVDEGEVVLQAMQSPDCL
ncbi:MAG: histidine phosphatase family protein [Caldimonas sp.]